MKPLGAKIQFSYLELTTSLIWLHCAKSQDVGTGGTPQMPIYRDPLNQGFSTSSLWRAAAITYNLLEMQTPRPRSY